MRFEDVKWNKTSSDKPIIIAGPCSVETEEQLYKSVSPLIGKVDLFRGGIWKPRTRPGNFEGLGEKGLKWISQLQKAHDIKFTIEVGTPEHVELALKYGIETVWIGARTTVNPFNVSEIAQALKGVDIAVMVKNPIHPELSLWKGALERFYKVGLKRLAAIHRGFHSYQKTDFRNIPMWQIPLDLKSEFPDLPLICDPSHIGGNRQMIAGISQKALDLSYDGLMIESHFDPDRALSDAQQQITPSTLIDVLQGLQTRAKDSDEASYQHQMEIIREQIDEADRDLFEALANRLNLVEKIGEIKKENNVAIFQLSRWKEIFKSRTSLGKKLNLDEKFVMEMLRFLHQQSVKKQTELFNKQEEDRIEK